MQLPHLSFQKVHSNCLFIVFGKNSFAVPLYHAAFADSSIANNYHFNCGFDVFFSHFNIIFS